MQHNQSHLFDDEIKQRAARIRMLALDVDGVLTDGGVYYDEKGLCQKKFNVQDGIGINLLKHIGVEVVVISGMSAPCVERRMEILNITEHHGGIENKATVLDGLRQKYNLQWTELAFLGDDWVDLAAMLHVGLPVAVANARPEVKEMAAFVTEASGGSGAVRELADYIIDCKGQKEALLEYWKKLT